RPRLGAGEADRRLRASPLAAREGARPRRGDHLEGDGGEDPLGPRSGGQPAMSAPSRLRVLLLSRNYPNSVFPRLGLWVQWLPRHPGGDCDVTVIAPVPWWPPLPGPEEYSRFRKVEPSRRDGSVEVLHPRFLAGPGYLFHSTEAVRYDLAIRRLTARIHRERRFDLVHAQFGYPDGVVAARLSRRLGIPA